MTSNVRKSPKIDATIWSFIVVVLAGAIGANFYYSAEPVAIRLIAWILLACVLVFLALQTQIGQQSWDFIKAARAELRKVYWPTRQETVQTTLVVFGMVIIMALALWGIDSILLWAVGILTGQRG